MFTITKEEFVAMAKDFENTIDKEINWGPTFTDAVNCSDKGTIINSINGWAKKLDRLKTLLDNVDFASTNVEK